MARSAFALLRGADLVFRIAVVAAFAGRQRGDESLLRHLDMTKHLHALLARLLLFEQLAFTGDITAIAFRQNILAQRTYVLTRDDAGADCGLDGNLELE